MEVNVIKWFKRGVARLSVGMKGSFAHKLDAKGRMVLPSRFRELLGDKVVATIGTGNGRCVSVYPLNEWEVYLSRLDEIASRGGKGREIRRIILASAHDLDIDSAGRILLPQQLRAYANIVQEVSINGISDHLEIWNMFVWTEHWDSMLADIGEFSEGIEGI